MSMGSLYDIPFFRVLCQGKWCASENREKVVLSNRKYHFWNSEIRAERTMVRKRKSWKSGTFKPKAPLLKSGAFKLSWKYHFWGDWKVVLSSWAESTTLGEPEKWCFQAEKVVLSNWKKCCIWRTQKDRKHCIFLNEPLVNKKKSACGALKKLSKFKFSFNPIPHDSNYSTHILPSYVTSLSLQRLVELVSLQNVESQMK